MVQGAARKLSRNRYIKGEPENHTRGKVFDIVIPRITPLLQQVDEICLHTLVGRNMPLKTGQQSITQYKRRGPGDGRLIYQGHALS
ncbi:hypothetical protein KDK_20930 [Dictyobacter kobayashii]|uniref:Uncharacterized protein n=1 Tax=Dictyobacter kobayashii TaxID=2014872 RepID=A0A402AGV8_9CHLR|nr:hypothetical protein KDK_20930 [Dictyobacter kobayashii]